MNDKLLEALGVEELPPFKPLVEIDEEMRITSVILEDVSHYSVPCFVGHYHTVDWLLAMDDNRIVGVQVWALKK